MLPILLANFYQLINEQKGINIGKKHKPNQ